MRVINVPLQSYLLEFLSWMGIRFIKCLFFFSNAFSLSLVMIIWFFSFNMLIYWITLIYVLMLKHPWYLVSEPFWLYFFNTLILYLIFNLELLHLCSWVELTCNFFFFKNYRFKDLFSFSVSSWDSFSHMFLRNYSFYLSNKPIGMNLFTILLHFNFLLEICHIFLFQRTNFCLCFSYLISCFYVINLFFTITFLLFSFFCFFS